MIISLNQFERSVPEYMQLAQRNPIWVVDTKRRKSWVIKKGDDYSTRLPLFDFSPRKYQHPKTV